MEEKTKLEKLIDKISDSTEIVYTYDSLHFSNITLSPELNKIITDEMKKKEIVKVKKENTKEELYYNNYKNIAGFEAVYEALKRKGLVQEKGEYINKEVSLYSQEESFFLKKESYEFFLLTKENKRNGSIFFYNNLNINVIKNIILDSDLTNRLVNIFKMKLAYQNEKKIDELSDIF